ncbi:MAG: DUF4419 domain-containing protein [Bacteroidales bacterium]|nr:DUF4419 domain-containing protein [Bacteroidales bacterium]
MKRILFVLLMVMIATTQSFANKKDKDIVIKKEKGSITFVVDENLTAPEKLLEEYNGEDLFNSITDYVHGTSGKVVASSFEKDELVLFSDNATFLTMMTKAYAEHRPVVLSPDDIWLLITQGFAFHVQNHAEELRNRLVGHEGKMTLQAVAVKASPVEIEGVTKHGEVKKMKGLWPEIFDQFEAQMKEYTKGQIVENLRADFSTTTLESRIASQITVMSALSPYFNYEVVRLSCGIPYVTLKGTPEDWQKILDRVRMLRSYDLDWWIDRLCPVLEEFVKTAQGKPNQQFWRCIMTQIAPDRYRSSNCVYDPQSTKLDGWLINFYPYDKEGERVPGFIRADDLKRMPKDVLSVDFKFKYMEDSGEERANLPMCFLTGFVGAEQDPDTYELTPRIGWIVEEKGEAENDNWISIE